jgi:hypothetical protein
MIAVPPGGIGRRRGVLRVGLLGLLLLAAVGPASGVEPERASEATQRACPKQGLSAAYSARVGRALRAKQDLWGNALLAAPNGPTYAGARRYLTPLLLARASKRTALTDSGVYYLPFFQPHGARGAGSVALHVADGSQIASDRADGRRLTVYVGSRGRERYGSCLPRLAPARLASGYLPILETRYVDAVGARYAQESFAGRIQETGSLVSFVRLTVDARRSAASARVRFTPSVARLTRAGNRVRRAGATYLHFSEGGGFDGSSLRYRVRRGTTRTVYVAWLNYPSRSRALTLDETAYDTARQSVADFWERRLAEGTSIVVPEKRVNDATRALLIQNLGLTYRYSIGNAYEQFSFPEGVDVAQVMGEYGFGGIARAILRTSLTRRPTPYPNWKMGEKLLGWASYYRLFRERSHIEQVTPVLRRYVAALGRQITASGRGMLSRERYSSDIPDQVYGLHSQAVAWQGLRAMARVWAELGQGSLARRCQRVAARLESGLRRAVRTSQRRLPDGSLFIPVRLLDREEPYDWLTESRPGSYWNLVMPYALASGFFRPGSSQATGALRYMLRHGSRLLGLVRAGAYALYREPVHPVSGTDQVYGINVARFLADNDESDHLVLSLYGALAAAMTPGTFVSGEAASVAPMAGRYYRAMYLPPNGASNAAFLETLRAMLVHETVGRNGEPRGLELGFATPRPWLRSGRRIVLRRAATSFGPVSFSIESQARSIRVSLEVPSRAPPRTLKLRLRLPRGNRMTAVALNGRPFRRFNARSETIDLSGQAGTLELVVGYRRRAP